MTKRPKSNEAKLCQVSKATGRLCANPAVYAYRKGRDSRKKYCCEGCKATLVKYSREELTFEILT